MPHALVEMRGSAALTGLRLRECREAVRNTLAAIADGLKRDGIGAVQGERTWWGSTVRCWGVALFRVIVAFW